jgi:hypothetical protein
MSTATVSLNKTNYDVYVSKFNRIKSANVNVEKTETNKLTKYDPVNKCKSGGIIPWTYHNGELLFLFQKINNPVKIKNSGWNDFGGSRDNENELSYQIAAREFCEETSCLFYLKEINDNATYDKFKNRPDMDYNKETITKLMQTYPSAINYYSNKIKNNNNVYLSVKEIYISYFMYVPYINADDLPLAEDIHIPYENRYIRTCKWFNINEIQNIMEISFHKRLRLTKIKKQITNYVNKSKFVSDDIYKKIDLDNFFKIHDNNAFRITADELFHIFSKQQPIFNDEYKINDIYNVLYGNQSMYLSI